jgi:hypothetical protein
MQPQPQSTKTTARVVSLDACRVVHSNVIQFRDEATKRGRLVEPLPLPPGEDGSAELVPPRSQTLWIAGLAVLSLLAVAARMAGLV